MMSPEADSSSYSTLLVKIESFAQLDPGIDSGLVDTEHLLLDSIESVKEELRRRYRKVTKDPLFQDLESGDCFESTTSNDPQVGWIFRYYDKVQVGTAKKHAPCQDLVRVYALHGETVAPEKWGADLD